jgi:dTMP kinase
MTDQLPENTAGSNGQPHKHMKKRVRKSGSKRAAKPKKSAESITSRFYGTPIPGVAPEELSGSLIVIEGTDGSGRSTQISLLTEWLESEGFAVQTMGLRRSFLVGEDIDALLAENAVTRMTLALMYGTDFFDQLERRILPALRSGLVVLADRYIFTLIARSAVRGIGRDYLHGLYEMALRPDLTFWLDVKPEVAFDREFKKSHSISYWESGRDLSLSNDLFQSFIRYQSMVQKEFEYLSKRHEFVEIDGERSVAEVNGSLRKRIAQQLGIRGTHYRPSNALAHLWR